jgi:2-oxoglutarate ferredoxin oxidoreductase subunit delta
MAVAPAAVLPQGQSPPDLLGALTRRPIDHPSRVRGVVTVIPERCKECEFCVHYCPKEVLEISPTYNPRGYRPVRVKESKKDDCICCRFCQDVCPEFAIFVEEAGK